MTWTLIPGIISLLLALGAIILAIVNWRSDPNAESKDTFARYVVALGLLMCFEGAMLILMSSGTWDEFYLFVIIALIGTLCALMGEIIGLLRVLKVLHSN